MSGTERMYLEFLFFAYTAVWVMMFGFLYRMGKRARQLEEEILILEDAFTSETKTPVDPGFHGPSV